MSRSSRARWLLVVWLLSTSGCVEHALLESIQPTEYPWPQEEPAPPVSEGGIWRGDSSAGSFLYFDRKARGVGDLVTVVLVENLQAAGSANTALDRQSGVSATVSSDLGLTDIFQAGARELLRLFGVGFTGSQIAAGQTVNALTSDTDTNFQGDGSTNRQSTFSGVVTCRIVDVLPGGVYHIYGKRKILVNHELQLVTIEGLVRRKDINIDNTVTSAQIADGKLTFDGVGVIDDEQRPPFFTRLVAWIYPF